MQPVPIGYAIAAQRPEWIVLIVTRREDAFVNAMPAGWVMRVSGRPPMFAVSVGHARYTNELIRQAGEFVLAFPSADMAETVAICGSHSGREMDKVERCNLQMTPARVLRTPLIEDAFINFECKLSSVTEAGDHTIFAGEVLASYMGDVPGPLVNFGAGRYALARPATE